jgi:putative phage-type endonuclease
MTNTQIDPLRRTFPKPKYLSQEWFEQRRTQNGGVVFGASECPSLMGASPFQSLMDLCIRKMNPEMPSDNNEATERGHILEPALLEYASRAYGSINKPNVMYHRDRLVATLDGEQLIDGNISTIFEAKTTTAYSRDDALPDSYFWQVQAQLDASGAERAVVVVLDKFMRFGFWEVEPHQDAIIELRSQAERIGAKLDHGTLIDDLDIALTHRQVEALFPKPVGTKELSSNDLAVIDEWQATKQQADMIGKRETELKNKVADMMRGAEIGIINGQKILSYKAQSRKGGYDIDGLLENHPEIIELVSAFRKPDSSFRVLRAHIK